MISLDPSIYPHIIDNILSSLSTSRPALCALRLTSREMQVAVERLLYRHVVVAPIVPGYPDVVFRGVDGLCLPGLGTDEADRPATAARLRNTRILDVVRIPWDTDTLPETTIQGKRWQQQAQPEWWMADLDLDTVRQAGPASLWKRYRDWDPEYWNRTYYTEFAIWGRKEEFDVRPPPARKAIFFLDLVPPHPLFGTKDDPDDEFPFSIVLPRNSCIVSPCPYFDVPAAIIHIRYEPDHPLLAETPWRWMFRHMSGNLPCTGRFTLILTPTRIFNDDESSTTARGQPREEGENFDMECDEVRKLGLPRPHSLLWSIHLFARCVPDENITVVGLEGRLDAALALVPPNRDLAWPEKRALIQERFERIDAVFKDGHERPLPHLGHPSGPWRETLAPRFMSVAEYRAEVGEHVWRLESSEPVGPWSEKVSEDV
jgi:hypothetical protein